MSKTAATDPLAPAKEMYDSIYMQSFLDTLNHFGVMPKTAEEQAVALQGAQMLARHVEAQQSSQASPHLKAAAALGLGTPNGGQSLTYADQLFEAHLAKQASLLADNPEVVYNSILLRDAVAAQEKN